MKAVILAAGVGSRIRPLTNDCPKSLLEINGQAILGRMLAHVEACGIRQFVVVVGYLHDQVRRYVAECFPDLDVEFVLNERYATTNTAYSLWLAGSRMGESDFVKLDADVVFDRRILEALLQTSTNYLCIDREIDLDAEEVKVVLGNQNKVVEVGKGIDPRRAAGESIGIEKIERRSSGLLSMELASLMAREGSHEEYYEVAYSRLIERDVPFYALDISGLDWVEIDNQEDFDLACRLFR